MECYLDVKEYAGLLNTNMMFLLQKIPYTFYYPNTWGEGLDQNDHAIVSTPNLLQLTEKYHLFTVDGQSSYCNDNKEAIEKAEKNLEEIQNQINLYKNANMFTRCFYTEMEELKMNYNKANEALNDEKNKIIMQRSYLEFFIEPTLLDKIKHFIMNDCRIWYYIIEPDKITSTNMPRTKICLSYNNNIYNTAFERREKYKSNYPNINVILDSLCLCMIVCKDFHTKYTADDIMIEYMKRVYTQTKPKPKPEQKFKKPTYFTFENI
jgi:hypothetical protein